MTDFDPMDRRRLAFAVSITGLPWRFCSHVCPGSTLDAGLLWIVGAEFSRQTDVLAVLSVGPREAHIDDLHAVAEQEPVEVRIQTRDARTAAGALVHPVHALGRIGGPESAERAVRLAATLPHAETGAGPVDIQVSASCAAWTLPGPVHIGQEVIWATAAETVGAVHRLTGCYRAADGWSSQEHVVSPRHYEEPWVTSEVTTWRGRWAQIWCAALSGSGDAMEWVPYWQGVLASAPVIRGDVITIHVAPYTAVMSYHIGVGSAARTAQTVAGWHRVVAGVCDLIVAREHQHVSIWWDGDSLIGAQSADGDTWLEWDAVDWATVEAIYSEALPLTDWWVGGGYHQRPSGIDAPNRRLLFGWRAGDNLPATVLAHSPVQIGMTHLRHDPAHLALWRGHALDEVVPWPGRLEDAWNEPTAGQTGPSCFADPTGLGGTGRMIRARLAASDGGVSARVVDLSVGTAIVGAWEAGLQLDSDELRSCWDGIVGDVAQTADAGAGWRQIGAVVSSRSELSDAAQLLPLGGVPVWWLGRGELWVGPLDAEVYSGGSQRVHFTGGDLPGAGVDVWVIGSEVVALPDGTTGYFLLLDPTHGMCPAIHVMPGQAPLTAQVVASSVTDPGIYLMRLLESGIGDGANGVGDALPIGANLPAFVINESAMLALGCPPPLQAQTYTAVRGKTIADQMEGILLACGAHVVQVYDEAVGGWRISVIHLGPVSGLESAQTISDADMITSHGDPAPVETMVDGRTVRSYTLRVNHLSSSGPVDIAVECSRERNDSGSDDGTPMELDLPGVVVTGGVGTLAQAAIDIVADARANASTPRVRWRFRLSATRAGAAGRAIGDTVTVTSSHAIPIRPTETVAGVPCRVVGIAMDPESDVMELEVRPYAGRSGGWGPSARVVSVPTANRAVVEDGYEAWFAAGDRIDCIPRGDWSGRVSRTVQSIDTGTHSIVTTAAHGLAAGDTVRLNDYSVAVSARSALAGYAWLADDDGLLPGGGAGQVIA